MEDEDRYTRITLRIPKNLHARIAQAAEATSKSQNAEIVLRLEQSFAGHIDKDLTFTMLNAEVQRLSEELRQLRAAAMPALADIGEQIEEQVRQVMQAANLSFEDALLLAVTRGAVHETQVPVVILQVAKGTTLEEARSLMQVINTYTPDNATVFYEQVDVSRTRRLTSPEDTLALLNQSEKHTPKE